MSIETLSFRLGTEEFDPFLHRLWRLHLFCLQKLFKGLKNCAAFPPNMFGARSGRLSFKAGISAGCRECRVLMALSLQILWQWVEKQQPRLQS